MATVCTVGICTMLYILLSINEKSVEKENEES